MRSNRLIKDIDKLATVTSLRFGATFVSSFLVLNVLFPDSTTLISYGPDSLLDVFEAKFKDLSPGSSEINYLKL